MKTYQKKPGRVEAMQWTGKNLQELTDFLGEALESIERRPDYKPRVSGHNMNIGDFVLCSEPKAFIVLDADSFNELYELV